MLERVDGSWTLPQLERLVSERGGLYPDRLDEWRSYLFFLRGHADIVSDRLPHEFDGLVGEVFGVLLHE